MYNINVKDFIRIDLNELFEGTQFEDEKVRIGVALSGGRDSIALCHILKTQGENIVALNVEHGIRGESSIEDSKFVKEFCSKENIPLVAKSIDVPAFAKENGYTIEQAARIMRYDFFDECIKNGICDVVALAHHSLDQVETILMRILRGTGTKGLIGMKKVSGNYIRPLLDYSREDIDEYIKENNLSYVEDETNSDTAYTRNFLREEIKTLKERYPSLEESFKRLSRNAEEIEEYLVSKTPLIEMKGNEAYVDIVGEEKLILKREFLAAANALGVYQDIEEKHYDILFDLMNKENGKSVNLTHGLMAHKEGKYIVFTKVKETLKQEFKFEERKYPYFEVKKISVEDAKRYIKLNSVQVMDAEKVEGAVIRRREDGDYIHKFGGGTKSLGDYLTDVKVSLRQRDDLYVVAKGSEILAIVGLEISSTVKVDENTKEVYIIKPL